MADHDSKACTKCGCVKPLASFGKNKLGAFGRRSVCKLCLSADCKARRAASKKPKPPRPVITEKLCSGCKEVKPVSEFHKATGKLGGVAARCKGCVSAYHREHVAGCRASTAPAPVEKVCPRCSLLKPASAFLTNLARKDKLSVYCAPCQKEYLAGKQYDRLRWALGREVESARSRAYREKHAEALREKWRASGAARREREPGVIRSRNLARKYSQKRATPPWANMDAINAIYKKAKRLELEDGVKRNVDHVVPIHHPLVCGLHVEHNLQILTAFENMSKHNKFEIQ